MSIHLYQVNENLEIEIDETGGNILLIDNEFNEKTLTLSFDEMEVIIKEYQRYK